MAEGDSNLLPVFEGDLTHVAVGPGGERVWTDEVGAAGAVQVSFRTVPYPGGYTGDPLDGKPTTGMSVIVDETKSPNYEVRIPVYDGGPIATKAMAYVMCSSIPESGLQPKEFDLVSRVVAESMADALSEFGHREGLEHIFRRMGLPQKLSPEQLERVRKSIADWKPTYAADGPVS